MKKVVRIIVNIAIPMAMGGLSALLTGKTFEDYKLLNRPLFSPPSMVFPIVWTLIYLMIGIATYLIMTDKKYQTYESVLDNIKEHGELKKALVLYSIQFIFHVIWSPVFFRLKAFFLAFVILAMLWYFVYRTMLAYKRIHKAAGCLFLPYLVWLTFAGYLNLGVLFLN